MALAWAGQIYSRSDEPIAAIRFYVVLVSVLLLFAFFYTTLALL